MEKLKCSRVVKMQTMPSMCDEGSYMTIPAVLDMFQDIAGLHAGTVGIGANEMEEMGLFWVLSRVRVKILSKPYVYDDLDVTTWIQPAERATCERDFSIARGGEVLAYGRSIWAALRRDNGRLAHMADFYPDADFCMDPPDDEPFVRRSKHFEDAEPLGEYRVRSIDIDRGGHMNNVNYVRAMLGCFTLEELNTMGLSELDIHFVRQCYEGDTIRFVKRPSEDMLMEIAAVNEEGTVVFMAAVK